MFRSTSRVMNGIDYSNFKKLLLDYNVALDRQRKDFYKIYKNIHKIIDSIDTEYINQSLENKILEINRRYPYGVNIITSKKGKGKTNTVKSACVKSMEYCDLSGICYSEGMGIDKNNYLWSKRRHYDNLGIKSSESISTLVSDEPRPVVLIFDHMDELLYKDKKFMDYINDLSWESKYTGKFLVFLLMDNPLLAKVLSNLDGRYHHKLIELDKE